jgi:hypothetical protein
MISFTRSQANPHPDGGYLQTQSLAGRIDTRDIATICGE